MCKPLLQITPNTAVLLPPCCLSLKGQIQPFFHRQRTKGLKDEIFRKRHSSLSALTVSSLLQEPWSLSVDGESSSCKGSQIPWWRWSSIYALQKVTRLPCLGPSYSMFPLGTWRLGQGVGEGDTRDPHSPPKFLGTSNPNKFHLFVLHVMGL